MGIKTYTTQQVSRLCDIHINTVLKWINEGHIKAFKTPGGHHRIPHDELMAFIKRYEMPIAEELKPQQRLFVIVSSDADTQDLLALAIESVAPEAKVVTLDNSIDALFTIAARCPELVILDVDLPDVDGALLCRKLKSHSNTKKIGLLAVSSAYSKHMRQKVETFADAFLAKPLRDLKQLQETIRRLVG